MSNQRIAHRYAKPFLELAEERKSLEKVKDDMLYLAELCQENREFMLMLKSPIIPHLKKASILKAIFGKRATPLTLQFLELVSRKNREMVLPDVAKEFLSLYDLKMGLQAATVTTTIPLSSSEKKLVEKLVGEISGKKVHLKEKINPELIGGYVLKLGDDQQIDDSVAGKLRELKNRFHKENR